MQQKLFTKNLFIGYLYISFSTPMFFLLAGLPMILSLEGFSPSAIGLFQLSSIPYITSFLFSPIVEGFVFKRNHYKKWIFIHLSLYIFLLFMISNFSLKEDYYLLFTLILFATFSSTLVAIPLNALSTKIFTQDEQLSAGGFKSSAYFISSLIGNGVMLLVYNSFGWSYTMFAIILLLLPSLIILYIINEPDSIVKKQSMPYKQIIEFFKQKNIFKWILILGTYFTFLFPIWIFLKPYLLSKGIEANHVVIIAGIYGSSLAAVGSLGVSFFAKNFDKKLLLFRFSLLSIFTVCLFIALEFFDLSLGFIILCVTSIAISKALSGSIIFALMMNNSRKEYKAIDYSVQSSIYALGGISTGIGAGLIIESFDYRSLFIIALFGMSMVSLFVYNYFRSTK